jgi:hypothetical protein
MCERFWTLPGVNFRVNDPAFAIGEVQYAYNQEKTQKDCLAP